MKLILKITNAALLILLLILVGVAVTGRTSVFGIRSYTVLTGSMQPSIPPGGIVFVQPQTDYNKGDIITYGVSGKVVTHRITATKNDQFITQGDANKRQDAQPVERRDIIGRVKLAVPYLGYVSQYMRTFWGFIGLIVAPALILIVYEIRNIYKELERSIGKKYEEKYSTALPE